MIRKAYVIRWFLMWLSETALYHEFSAYFAMKSIASIICNLKLGLVSDKLLTISLVLVQWPSGLLFISALKVRCLEPGARVLEPSALQETTLLCCEETTVLLSVDFLVGLYFD